MKKIFKSIIFLIILILSFSYYEKKIFNRYDVLVDYAYYKIPKDSIDLLFIGSSHSYCTFNTRLFDHYLKCNSLNLGTNSQSFSITYSGILEILKYQTPKVIVVEIFPIAYDKVRTVAIRPHLDTMKFSINKLRLIKNSLAVTEWGNHSFNTIYYHSRWKEFNNLKNSKDKGYENWGWRIENKGFLGYAWDSIKNILTYDIYEKEWNKHFNASSTIDNGTLNLLENLFKVCQEKEIRLILVSPPIIADYNTLSVLYNSNLKDLMNKYNVDSIDFNDGSKKYEKICFLDNGHVSLAGADEVSFKMAKYLKQNYPILLNTKNYEKYEKDDRSSEYYFYSKDVKEDNNFKIFNLELEFEKGIIINNLKIYKKSDNSFDLFFEIDENKSSDKIYETALDDKEINAELDKIQLNFKTIKDDKQEFPKYYIRRIKDKKYIYKKNLEIPKDSKYYF